MRLALKSLLSLVSALGAMLPGAARSDDADALSIEAEAPRAAKVEPALKPGRLVLEVAGGIVQRRYGASTAGSQRLSLDYSHTASIGTDWRWGLSNRLDVIRPRDDGLPDAVNSLREAYVGWSDSGGRWLLELGRINLRLGPGYGYNPTDYFRSGTVRVVTTPDPMAQRENRQGTVMFRAQRLWANGASMLILAPRVSGGSSDAVFSTEFESTNAQDRALLTLSGQASERVSGQLLLMIEKSKAPSFGASATALLGEQLVAHAEVSSDRERSLFAQFAPALGGAGEPRRNRMSAGLTFSTANRSTMTVEYEYDGHAPKRGEWRDLFNQAPTVLVDYLQAAQFQQQLAGRAAWLVYGSKKGFIVNDVDISGFVKLNAEDKSQAVWTELRRHWEGFDLALQWQAFRGKPASQFGILRQRQSLQLLLSSFF